MATSAGRLLSETKDNAATVYTYYKTGELRTATDAENNTATYSYDNMGNVTTVRNALGNSTLYEYDKVGDRGRTLVPCSTIFMKDWKTADKISGYDKNGTILCPLQKPLKQR